MQAKVEPVVAELTTESAADLFAGSALVVDAFDNRAARAAVSAVARASGVPCLHVGFSPDGLYGSAIWEPGYRVPHDVAGDPCDYPRSHARWSSSSPPWRHEQSWPTSPTAGARTSR